VWVDHALAPSNFGPDIMHGYGDQPGHPVYHADMTLGYGIEYLWRGRVTSVIGQDRPLSFGGLWKRADPLDSARTIAKEAAKHMLGLLDGQHSRAFLRCNPHHRGIELGDRGDAVHEVLTPEFLERLSAREGNCILYTHLGKLEVREGRPRFGAPAIAAFANLARYDREGRILVTATHRLLDYHRMKLGLDLSVAASEGTVTVRLAGATAHPDAPAERRYAGLTLRVADPAKLRLQAEDGGAIPFRVDPPDESGRPCVSIAWPRLRFPDL
jgi:hypothetical protein